jgi:hypothetical protein
MQLIKGVEDRAAKGDLAALMELAEYRYLDVEGEGSRFTVWHRSPLDVEGDPRHLVEEGLTKDELVVLLTQGKTMLSFKKGRS